MCMYIHKSNTILQQYKNKTTQKHLFICLFQHSLCLSFACCSSYTGPQLCCTSCRRLVQFRSYSVLTAGHFYLFFLNSPKCFVTLWKNQAGGKSFKKTNICDFLVPGLCSPLFLLFFLCGCALPVLPVGQWWFVTASAVGQGDARSHQSRVPMRQRQRGGERGVLAPFTARIVTQRSLLALLLQLMLCPAPSISAWRWELLPNARNHSHICSSWAAWWHLSTSGWRASASLRHWSTEWRRDSETGRVLSTCCLLLTLYPCWHAQLQCLSSSHQTPSSPAIQSRLFSSPSLFLNLTTDITVSKRLTNWNKCRA